METVVLRQDDLLLRPWRPSDADAVHRACQDPDIARWTTLPTPYLTEHAEDFVRATSPQRWTEGSAAGFGVFDAATGDLLGSNGLVSIDHVLGSAEIGYWTAPWARGRGVAVRSSRLVARWAFEELGLQRLVWQAVLGNHLSRLTALRVGFRVEGRMRLVHPVRGIQDGWVASLVPSDLMAKPPVVDPLVVRRARLFAGEPPVLRAETSGGPVTLRRATAEDVDVIVASCRDPEAVAFTTVPDPYQRHDATSFVSHMAEAWAAGTEAAFGVYDASDSYCGSLSLRLSPTDPLIADVGYLIGSWARGRGYATAALTALCRWGFGALGLARIEWRAHVGNEASRRVAEKAGFRVEGVERAGLAHRGERRDCWVGALLPSDIEVGEE